MLKDKIRRKDSFDSRQFSLATLFKIRGTFTNPFLNRNSYKEKDAWEIGDRYSNEYKKRTHELKKVFPYFSKYTLGIK